MKKFLGIKKKDEMSGQAAPPPPPPRAGGPSSSYSSSRNLDESEYTAEGSGRNIPQQQQNDNTGGSEFPSDEVLATKLRDFYLVHDAKKATDLDKIIAAAKKNGLKWLQDGLQRKYNGATIDFSDSSSPSEYSNGDQDAEMEPEVDEPPPPKPPPPPPAKAPPVPPPAAAAPPMVVPPPMHNVGGGNNMFISAQPPPSFMGEAHAVAYPNAATALKSKGLGKYVKQLEERGIVNYEDLATLEESQNDPLWMSMPPIPDRKNLRTLVQTVKDYVASASFLGEAPSPAGATNVASPRSTSTPFDDHPELVEETQASSPQAAAIPIPFAPPQRAPVPQFAPPPPPKRFGEEATEEVEDTSNAEAEEESHRLEQEENERQARIQAEEAQRKKREAEEKRRLEEEQQQRKRKEAASAPPPPPAKSSNAPPPPPAKAVPPPPAVAMKRKQSSESQMVPVAQIEEAERVVAELKDKLDDQNSLCEKLVSKAEELAKQLEDAQAEAEQENEKLEKITAEFEGAQAKLASLRAKQKAAAAQPPPPVVFAPPPPQQATVLDESFDEQTAEEEQHRQEDEEQDSGMLKAAPPPPSPAVAASGKLERSASGNKLTRVESTKSVSSTEGEPRATILSGGSHQAEIAQEASQAKLRATTTREKTVEPCNNYEVDLKATEFGQCVCGHKRSEHKAGGTSPAAPFHTAGSGRFAPGRASITKEHSSFRDNAAATSPSAVMAPESVSPGKAENPYAAKGMYPALEPCDNFQVDMSASAFGMCQCGHLKQHHKMTSPTSAKELPKLRSSRTIGENELPQVHAARTSGDSNSGTFPKPAGVGMDAPVPPAATAAVPGTKPPPPARRPSALAAANSSRQMAAAPPPAEEKKAPAPPPEEPPAAQPQTKETNGADAGPDHRSRLIDFYTKYNPEKLNEVDTILAKFKGKELVMFKKLKEKYPDADI